MLSTRIWCWYIGVLWAVCYVAMGCKMTQRVADMTTIVPVHPIQCDTIAPIRHFFSKCEGDSLHTEYTTLAVIHVSSGNHPQPSPLYALKYAAAHQCADGIIKIHQRNSIGQYNEVKMITLDEDGRNSRRYEKKSYTALAVKLKDPLQVYRYQNDSNFIQKINSYRARKYFKSMPCKECDAKKGHKGLLIAGGSIVAAFIAMVVMIR